jgi:CrcB protein
LNRQPVISSASASVGCWAQSCRGGTRFIDITGSLLIGLFAIRWTLPQAVRILLTVGICGGYTTFSTFSLDFSTRSSGRVGCCRRLHDRLSVVLSVSALIAGIQIVRLL